MEPSWHCPPDFGLRIWDIAGLTDEYWHSAHGYELKLQDMTDGRIMGRDNWLLFPSNPPDSLASSSLLNTLTVTLGPWEVCRGDSAEVVPRFPAVFVSWMCSLSWWCNVDWVIEPYLLTSLCEIIKRWSPFSLHISSPQAQCVRCLGVFCLVGTEVKGAWVNKILFVGFTLPLLVIYLFLHLQVIPGLLHTT